MEDVVLGFSGGVDSAVSALLLQDEGHRVYCVYLDNGNLSARNYAVSAAERMSLPLTVIDVREEMEELVCKPFQRAYMDGRTPNPCILCNPVLKFKKLLEHADGLGIRSVATGHYARSENGGIYKGLPANDQSYLLCRLERRQAERLILPLGRYEKAAVRSLALERSVPAAKKPDSQEICFIPGNDYRSWLAERGCTAVPGDMLLHGKTIGRHSGFFHYTVGQRIPGFHDGRKLYVSEIDARRNAVLLAYWEETFFTTVLAAEVNWLIDPPVQPFRASVRVRHTKWENPLCTVFPEGDGLRIVCDEAVRAPAPGQSAALYDRDRLIGSGIIEAGVCADPQVTPGPFL